MAAPRVFVSNYPLKLFLLLVVFVSKISTNLFEEHNDKYKSIDLDAFPFGNENEIVVKALPDGQQKLVVLCYPGQRKKWYRLWTNPKITVEEPGSNDFDYKVFRGDNKTKVVEESELTYLPWPSPPFMRDQFIFYPFNASCIGIASTQNYVIRFTVKNPDYFFVGMAAAGFLIFFSAASWSRNVALHYSVGVSVGVLGSAIIVLFIAFKFVPQRLKNITYVLGAVSTSVSLFLYEHINKYLNDIFYNNWKVLCCYVLISGIISFAIVYRYGPVTDSRSLDLVKWSLQFLGLFLVYNSSQISDMSIAIILIVLAAYNIPHYILPQMKKFRFRLFPPKRRYLTEEEFRIEADVETKKALEELRQYCRSPDCNAWKTVSCLVSPSKFSHFMEGDSHISDTEFETHINESEVNVLDFSVEDSDSDQDSEVTSLGSNSRMYNGFRKPS